MSGHAGLDGNPGKFEPCRRFEVGFHNIFLVHPGTKTAARLGNRTPKYLLLQVRIFIPGQLSFNSVSKTELKVKS